MLHPIPLRYLYRRLIVPLAVLMVSSMPNPVHAGVSMVVRGGMFNEFVLDDDGFVWFLRNDDHYGHFEKVEGLNDIVSICPFGAVRRDGKVLTWEFAFAPLPPGTICPDDGCNLPPGNLFTSPKIVEGIDHAVSIVGESSTSTNDHLGKNRSRNHYLVLRSDGHIATWGQNFEWINVPVKPGEAPKLKYRRHKPHLIPGITNVIAITYDVALTSSGKLYGWGWNFYGQFGKQNLNGEISESSPTIIYSDKNIRDVTMWGSYTIALTNSGDVIYFGGCKSYPGQSSPDEVLFGKIDDDDNIRDIGKLPTTTLAAKYPILYVRNDGSIWAAFPRMSAVAGCGCMSGNCARAKKVDGMDVAAIATSDGLAIGIDHSLWRASTRMDGSVTMLKMDFPTKDR